MYRTTVAERVELGLIMDHSGWARSVRWSCGRPGFTAGISLGLDYAELVARARLQARMAAYVGLGIVQPRADFRVTAV
jgi:hypothetical protein